MKTKLPFLFAKALIFTACAQSLKLSNPIVFESNKSGIIGVFRQPVGFCSGGYQQTINLGGEKVLAKPTWTSDQDNIFSAHIAPGQADLTTYNFA